MLVPTLSAEKENGSNTLDSESWQMNYFDFKAMLLRKFNKMENKAQYEYQVCETSKGMQYMSNWTLIQTKLRSQNLINIYHNQLVIHKQKQTNDWCVKETSLQK